jgi:hypothetical protein
MIKSGKLTEVQAREVCPNRFCTDFFPGLIPHSETSPFSRHSFKKVSGRHMSDGPSIFPNTRTSSIPLAIPKLTSRSTPLPVVDEQLDAIIWTPDSVVDRVVQMSLKPQPTYISSAFVETVKLMEIGARIMNTLYVLR